MQIVLSRWITRSSCVNRRRDWIPSIDGDGPMTRSIAIVWISCVVLAMGRCARAVDDPPAANNELLRIGQGPPEFEGVTETGQSWKLRDHVGQKVMVFYFYPGDFTGGCIKQAQSFREGLKSLEDLD